jgi:hypothetical protein
MSSASSQKAKSPVAWASASFRAAAKSSIQANFEHPRAEFERDLPGPVGAAGIDDDDLVEDPAHRFEAMRQVVLLISHDHGQADPCV